MRFDELPDKRACCAAQFALYKDRRDRHPSTSPHMYIGRTMVAASNGTAFPPSPFFLIHLLFVPSSFSSFFLSSFDSLPSFALLSDRHHSFFTDSCVAAIQRQFSEDGKYTTMYDYASGVKNEYTRASYRTCIGYIIQSLI